MGTLNEDLKEIKKVEDTLTKNKVSRFAYTEKAYTDNDANGVDSYDFEKEQNIPDGTADIMKVNQTVIDKGYRAQASSITRMLLNHFLGRLSYNLNKVNDNVSSLLTTLQSHLGKANGIASLDENGRVPYSQLPESAMELKGEWDASTNTPELVDGTGTNGDFYVVTVAGTQTFGGKTIKFQVNDRILYNGSTSTWIRLQAGGVYSVNEKTPDETGNITLDAPDVNAIKTINNKSPDKKTGNINLGTLRINGKTYDGMSFLDAGVQTIEHGGTGTTTAKDAANTFINSLPTNQGIVNDSNYFISQYKDGPFSPFICSLKPVSILWGYIKDKISSVLGLTKDNYGGKASTAGTAESANKIVPKYTKSLALTTVTTSTTKYIKVADCTWSQTGTLQVRLAGDSFEDTLVINFGGSNSLHPMLCGYCNSHVYLVKSVIAQKGSAYDSNYSIYMKINQRTHCNVQVALLKGDCTINFTESTTAPTNISEWPISNGFFGNLDGNATTATNAYKAYSGMVHTCSTASGTKEKTVSIPGFTLTQGACIKVKFLFGNSVKFPTLDVNDTGAHQILGARGSLETLIESSSDITTKSGLGVASWDTGIVLDLYYDGHNAWEVIGDPIVKKFYDGTSSLHKNVSILGNVQTSILY